jgi:tRNA (guanosine-2'-O-)-methyltransferase
MTRNLTGTELKRLHRDWRRRTDGRLALVLDGVQNPFNVGSILRSAAAYGVDHLWLVPPTPALSHPKVQKTALGSQRYLASTECATIDDALAAATEARYTTVGVELADGAGPLFETPLAGDVCLVLGHEDRGLSKDALAACDHLCYLPQVGKIASLNVATAAAIAMYEARRQTWST